MPDYAPGRRANIENIRLITAGARDQRVINNTPKLHFPFPAFSRKFVHESLLGHTSQW
jgi:hypothetical protein